jgi:glucose/arabinose dehydrogenase
MRTTTRFLAAALVAALTVAPAAAQSFSGPQVESVLTASGPIAVQDLAGGLNHPWGMAFLPDGRLLVTERNSGELHVLSPDGTLSAPVEGTPNVFAQGQGGLLDVALDPDFATNSYVYLSYAEPGPEGSAAAALGRGRWTDDRIEGFERIFLQEPWITGQNHFGNRIVFDGEGHLFLTLGERFQFDPAQDLGNHLGKVIRINHDGSIPADNPFVGDANAQDEIWSYGHRNVQAAALHPETGQLWLAEMGPLGGDELNQPEAGKNYGWPVVSWGINYDGSEIPDPPTRPDFADAAKHWSPVISPSGMVIYTGDVFPAWSGNVFIGSLSGHQLVRLEMTDGAVTGEERIPLGTRIRDVEQGPDGALYVLTDADDGHVWRIAPMK